MAFSQRLHGIKKIRTPRYMQWDILEHGFIAMISLRHLHVGSPRMPAAFSLHSKKNKHCWNAIDSQKQHSSSAERSPRASRGCCGHGVRMHIVAARMLLRSISKFLNLESGLWLSLHVPQFLSFSDCKIPGETRSTHPFPSTSHFKLVCVLTGFHLCLFWFMNYQYTVSILMLINTIHKGSVPDSNSTTYPMGASLSDILFSFVLEKYIVCDVSGLRSPSFESSSVLYISPTDTSSMQNFILQGLQQKLQKSCSRCHKKTWHVESSCILQPPKYLLLFDNRFRYINNNVTKDRCSTPMDKTVRLGPLKFSLRATIDHHGPSIHSGHYTASINCCKKRKNILLQRSHNYGVWNYWQQKLIYCVCYTIWIDWH